MIDDDPTLPHVLSLGAGVQSSTLALMAAHGEVAPMPTLAIFADTGWEPKAVYDWFEWLVPQLPFPVVTVTGGDIRAEALQSGVRVRLGKESRWVSMPYFTRGDGDKREGRIPRQCTAEYKIEPIEQYMKRELLGLPYRARLPKEPQIIQWRGISLDERQRAKLSTAAWFDVRYPLIELRMTRGHCLEWMAEHGYPEPPRSSCIGCPFHSDAEWLRMKASAPEEFADAVEFDTKIRIAGGPYRPTYLHRSCVPLSEVQFSTAESEGQLDMFGEECAGMCGV